MKPIYKLTAEDWREDEAHRKRCRYPTCDHSAHHYAKAHADGRVLVDGIPVDEHGAPIPPTRRPGMESGSHPRLA